jgi:hypothetical protein
MLDTYNVYMVLRNKRDVWWQGLATDGGDALEKAWDYALADYKSEPQSWDIEREEDESSH